jgi:hypothetical protein
MIASADLLLHGALKNIGIDMSLALLLVRVEF